MPSNNHLVSIENACPAPRWPKRAIVTAGMPYGNKALHFGHIGGVFVPADCYARFLRDRIGAENVIFVSGTDCYGSPIEEGYRKAVDKEGYTGTIQDYIRSNHEKQKEALDAFQISLNIFEGSGLGHAGDVHTELSNSFIRALYNHGHLRLVSTKQFYDPQEQMFLNGRQVEGFCPVQGCKATKAYADECELGHQYNPQDLVNPTSTISGLTPEMREVSNWYFDLPDLSGVVRDYAQQAEADPQVRPLVAQTIKEFLAPPIIYIKNELFEEYQHLSSSLPEHTYHEAEKGKQSFSLEFNSVADREDAQQILEQANIRMRTGKTLVPFRISGNSWGVPIEPLDGVEGLTFWCWPESLWAPISFTMAYLDSIGAPRSEWRDYWCSKDARVFQFIGQDNLYFYGVAQPALFAAQQQSATPVEDAPDGQLQQTKLIANHHILFGKKKASSSGDIKPPTGPELLEHYTVEQLRAHFLALALDQKSVGFKPKPFEADEKLRDDPRVADPVLKEGALLTKVFNRVARSCLYEAAKNFNCTMPIGPVSEDVLKIATQAISDYEMLMYKVDLHSVMTLMDEFIRYANKYWTSNIREAQNNEDETLRRQVLLDTFYLLRIATLLMHPIVPQGTERICDYLNFEFDDFFSWNYDFQSMEELCSAQEQEQGFHAVCELPPKTDFFKFHSSQK